VVLQPNLDHEGELVLYPKLREPRQSIQDTKIGVSCKTRFGGWGLVVVVTTINRKLSLLFIIIVLLRLVRRWASRYPPVISDMVTFWWYFVFKWVPHRKKKHSFYLQNVALYIDKSLKYRNYST